jgi:hypothetical protein
MRTNPAGASVRNPLTAVSRLGRRVVRITEQMRVRNAVVYSNLAVLTQRYGPAPGLASFELKVFSQNGEDGVIAEILHRIGAESKFFVEFGAGAGREANAVLLADVYNWSGLFIEASPAKFAELEYKYTAIERVTTRHSMLTAENIECTLRDAAVPPTFDLLSIDIDGNDYWVWRAIEKYRPRVVVCEYNGAIDPVTSLTQPYAPSSEWDRTEFFGASLKALTELGRHKGYTLVHCELTGTNAFFVADEHAHEFADCMPVPARRSIPGLTDFRHRPDQKRRAYETPDPTALPPRREDGHH